MANKFKRKTNGGFEKWLGKNRAGTNQLFRMPSEISLEEATLRWQEIQSIWEGNRQFLSGNSDKNHCLDQIWDDSFLKLAKKIARGKPLELESNELETEQEFQARVKLIHSANLRQFKPASLASSSNP